jgi:hypothetical protein
MILLAVTTDGRAECIEPSLASLLERVSGLDGRRLIFDDSGDRSYRRWLRSKFGPEGFAVVGSGFRLGQDLALRAMWRTLRGEELAEHAWVMHAEDDFLYEREVDARELCEILAERPYLAQMALLRQPWFPAERQAGGIVQRDPEAYALVSDGSRRWLEHRLWFTLNPCLYSRRLCSREWPRGRRHEWRFGRELCLDPDVRFGIWGGGEPWVTHIGERRVGRGY